MEHERAQLDQHGSVFQDRFDPREERRVHLENLNTTVGRFGRKSTGARDRVDGVSFVQAT